MISEILSMLKNHTIVNSLQAVSSPNPSEAANHPQTADAGGSDGVAGHGAATTIRPQLVVELLRTVGSYLGETYMLVILATAYV
jgi:hypothetical protein